MEITDLYGNKFNAVHWINDNYKNYTEEIKASTTENTNTIVVDNHETALNFINNNITELQLHVEHVNRALEENKNDILSNMPRIIKESQSLLRDVEQLRQRMCEMREEVFAVQKETGECMSKLERLNTIQMKLRNAKESLQESDGWGNLISLLEDSFERNDFKDICIKIVTLQKSLIAQEKLPGHVERQSQVEDFKNRLEALASPSVVQCFTGGNINEAQRFVSIFETIGRSPQLLQYYRAVQKTLLQQRWKHILDLCNADNAIHQSHFLAGFYDELLENCRQQVKWCTQVFKGVNSQEQPFIVLAELLPALQPTRDQYILQLFKTCNERLDLLLQFARDNETFVAQMNAYLDQQAIIKLSAKLKQRLAITIFEYFHKFIQQYPRLEETYLSTQIDRMLIIQTNTGDAVRHLRDSTNKMFNWLIEALGRCSSISSDIVLFKFIKVLNSIYKRLLEQFSRTQRQLTLNVGQPVVSTVPNESNWSLLQHTLSLLECLAAFQHKLQKFEETLYERMKILQQKLIATNQLTMINFYQTLEATEHQKLLDRIHEFRQKRLEMNQDNQLNSLDIGIFMDTYNSLKTLFTETHDITLNILLKPLEIHFLHIQPPKLNELGQTHLQEHMPTFSFAPQESITQIGQYLLTLPQHLEPLLLTPSHLLKHALEMSNIKYSQPIPSVNVLLNLVVEQCCITYQTQILQMKALCSTATRQLIVDIEYLSSVLEELGLNLSVGLNQILTLLKASSENYVTLSVGSEPRLVSAIRQLRNINIISKE